MGIGDEIMVTGQVRRMAEQQPGIRVAIREPRLAAQPNWQRWHYIWSGNPNIAQPNTSHDAIIDNAPGNRPYISGKTVRAWIWNEYKPEPGALYLTDAELKYAKKTEGRIVIQPFIKASASPNKRWPLESWQELIAKKPRWPWLQIGEGAEPRIGGVEFLYTPNFRDACGALSGAALLVSHEGALHHAAAALDVKAIVLFGGFISPAVTGYSTQTNLFVASDQHPLGCGSRMPCFHCHRAMLSIRAHHVIKEMESLL